MSEIMVPPWGIVDAALVGCNQGIRVGHGKGRWEFRNQLRECVPRVPNIVGSLRLSDETTPFSISWIISPMDFDGTVWAIVIVPWYVTQVRSLDPEAWAEFQ